MFYMQVGLKLLAAFVSVIIFMNLSGRAQLAPTSAADQIGNYVLGGIIGGVLYNSSIHVLEMVVLIAIWGLLMFVARFIKNKNRVAKRLIDGRSILMFDQGKILTENLRLANKATRDFIADMHMRGVRVLDELESVWLETNGQYTLRRKGDPPFPTALIEDGQYVRESLRGDRDKAWLESELEKRGYPDKSRIAYAEWRQDDLTEEGALIIYANEKNR